MIQGHGGNIYAMARQFKCRPEEIIDMSSNINPLGMPPGLLDHLMAHLKGAGALPEVDSRTTIRQMAGLLDVAQDRFLAGNGTTQFIYTACAAVNAEKVLIVGPTYSDYADACHMHHIQPHYFLADADHRCEIDLGLLDKALNDIDTVFICNPNNPTGQMIFHRSLVELCRSHPHCHFFIDESYLPFVPTDESASMTKCELENVSVFWSLSKIFSIPGLRAGFLIAHQSTIKRFMHYMQPWSLNSIAQSAVDYLAQNRTAVFQFMEDSHRFLEKERQLFHDGLISKTRMIPLPSRVSYTLIRLPGELTADKVCSKMAENRILIRNCSNFYGLSDRFVRVALKNSEQNRFALKHLAYSMS